MTSRGGDSRYDASDQSRKDDKAMTRRVKAGV
jgi:hypothetical protein